ncbi:MAG: UvrD-helicase domain-containing protein [Euryarchaeota archaeon]|nr:UvrD-helicase domain-containing protein [Euryarchaeota archaeon]MDE2045467.1 UvrD-helicase domain-containing protein [Thermoplasmata archaeon]
MPAPESAPPPAPAVPLPPPPPPPPPPGQFPPPPPPPPDHDPQVLVVDLTSDVLLTASAGTGKTHALVGRFLAAISDPREPGGHPAAQVPTTVAITFNIAAAAEMRKRVERAMRHTATEGSTGSAQRRSWEKVLDVLDAARISTIHAFCASLLREHPLEARTIAGVTPGFEILDGPEAAVRWDEAVRATWVRLQRERGELWDSYLDLSSEFGGRELATALRELQEHRFLVTPSSLRTRPPANAPAPARPFPATFLPRLADLWEQVQREYAQLKRERGALDFDDLEETALLLVSDPDMGDRIRAGIRHLLVDEFQDVSPRQLRLLLLLRGREPPGRRALFAVGDPKQSIYAFRGARGALRELRTALPGLKQARLERTRRFRDPLASFVNHLSSSLLPSEAIDGPYTPILPADPLAATAPSPTGVEVVWLEGRARATPSIPRDEVRRQLESKFIDPTLPGPVASEESLERSEAAFIATWVEEVLRQGRRVGSWRPGDGKEDHALAPGDIAVLLSYRRHQEEYVAALRARGLKVVTHPGAGFHDRPEVLDVLNLLAVLAREGDEVALYALLRSPIFGCSDEEIATWFLPFSTTPPLSDALARRARDEPSSRAAEVSGCLERWRARRSNSAPSELLRDILEEVGAWGVWADDGRGGRAVANIEKLLDIVRGLPGAGVVGLSAIHQHLLELSERERDEPEAGVELARDAINVMTVHAAKGLEFPVVIVPGLQRQWTRPGGPLLVSLTGEVALAPRDASDEVDSPETGEKDELLAAYERVKGDLARDEEHEARRLLYVAVTRAREQILLTCVQRRSSSGVPLSSTREPWRRWVDEAFHLDTGVLPLATPEGWRLLRRPAPTVPEVEPTAGAGAGPTSTSGEPVPLALLPPGRLLRGGGRATFTISELDQMRQCEARWWDARSSPLEEGPQDLSEGQARPSATTLGARSSAAIDPARLGSMLHGILAEVPSGEEEGLRLALQRETTPLLPVGAPRDQLVEALMSDLKWTFQQDAGTPGGPPLREEPFLLLVDNTVLRGRADALFLGEGIPMVEDYKFGPSDPGGARRQAGDFDFQLACYALAVRRGRRPVHVRLTFPRARTAAVRELSPLELDEFHASLRELVAKALRVIDGEVAPSPCSNPACPTCSQNARSEAAG